MIGAVSAADFPRFPPVNVDYDDPSEPVVGLRVTAHAAMFAHAIGQQQMAPLDDHPGAETIAIRADPRT